jgi:hypothetical protein
VGDLAKDVEDDLLKFDKSGYEDLIFSYPIFCLLCNRAISTRVIEEVKKLVKKDQTHKMRDWFGLMEACHRDKIKEAEEEDQSKGKHANNKKSRRARQGEEEDQDRTNRKKPRQPLGKMNANNTSKRTRRSGKSKAA